jgi:hypothetical protein
VEHGRGTTDISPRLPGFARNFRNTTGGLLTFVPLSGNAAGGSLTFCLDFRLSRESSGNNGTLL